MADERPIGLAENLSGVVDFVLADPLYNVPRDQKDDRLDYDVVGLSDVMDMARIMGYVQKLGLHGIRSIEL